MEGKASALARKGMCLRKAKQGKCFCNASKARNVPFQGKAQPLQGKARQNKFLCKASLVPFQGK
jgi:hypothetical protein